LVNGIPIPLIIGSAIAILIETNGKANICTDSLPLTKTHTISSVAWSMHALI